MRDCYRTAVRPRRLSAHRRCDCDARATARQSSAFRRTRRRFVFAALVVSVVAGCGGHANHGIWALSSGDLAGTRSASGSAINSGNVAALRVRWRFPFSEEPSSADVFASTPVVDQETVYVQDRRSNIYALNRATGAVLWAQRFRARMDGPNGLAVDGGRVYGTTDADAFALSASNGRELWHVSLPNGPEQRVDSAPVAWEGLVLLSLSGSTRLGRGAIYALDAATGAVRWKFATISQPPHPVSVDTLGRLYAGNSPRASIPGSTRYTDSLLALDAATGRPLWHDQAVQHDLRDDGFEGTPILATLGAANVAFGAGKAGHVTAWNRETRRRLWTVAVGRHVCPGRQSAIETAMAYAEGRIFVPVVNSCRAVSRKGSLVALDARTGHTLWLRRLPSPDFGCATVSDDVVFSSTLDGTVYAFAALDGRLLWHARMRSGVNACPAVVDDTLLVGSGITRPGGAAPELVAFALRRP
jgi:outer membrane protein assembly factor BamB